MRIIKFRAWDKKEKRMFKVKSLIWTYIFLIEEEDRSQRHGSGETELMQYTGLFDKNGKEMYEGDLIVFHSEYGKWKPKEVYWKTKGVQAFALKNTDLWLSDYDAEKMEIIGNIYENPELVMK